MGHDPQAAIGSLIKAIQSNPRELGAYCALARAYASAGEFDRAELTLKHSIGIDPFHGATWLELGALFSHLGNWAQSAEALERTTALEPGDFRAWAGYAMALIAVQDLERAAGVRDTLLQRFPTRSESHLVAGHIAKIRGEFQDATSHYHRALHIDPRQSEVIFNLVELSLPGISDPFTRRLESLNDDRTLSYRQRANVCFALARIYERAGEVDRAFSLYEQANSALDAMMRMMGTAYDQRALEEDTDRIIRTFSAEALSEPLEPLDLDLKPIFVVGLPRSGTTLVERILGNEPRVSVGGELPFMQDCLATLLASLDRPGGHAKIKLGAGTNRELLVRLRENYLDGLFQRELDGDFVTDKLPANFRAVGLIHLLFPNASIVHCVRDPIATCWSLYTAHLGTHVPYYTSLERLAHYHDRIYSRLMSHWKGVLPEAIVEVRYEELVLAPEDAARALLQSCGLSQEFASRVFDEARHPMYTASMIQGRQPIYASSVSRWKDFEKHLAPLVQRLQLKGASPK